MNKNIFTWVPFFEELADCLLKYKNNRKELIALVKQAHELVGKSLPKIESDNNNIPDIDPFTIYALFNRGKQSTNSRSQICEGYKRTFGIKSDVPTDFSGIPVYAYNQYCFYRYINDPKRVKNCFELLWALFESAIEYSRDSLNSQRFSECFEKSLNLPMVGFAKLTMGLYQMRPTTYVNIDKINVPLIETKIKIPRDINAGKEYLSFCTELKNNLHNSFNCDTFFELSFLAFQYSVDSTHTQPIPIENVDFHIETNNNGVSGQALMGRYSSKNIILYGPPGTGKTFNTMAYAVAIIEKKDFNEVKVEADEDYSKVKDRYENYKTTGLIDFVTFHQSYGYEVFIEGIKPQTENEQVTYNVEPGVFQKFCDIARVSGLQQNADYGFNSSPTIWKVSLKGTGKNDIRDYCLKNDCIRIGYDSEPSGMAAGDEFVSGKNILNAFINDMRVGDVVFSCYSNTSIDAIGVVAGDYEWKKESFQEYKRFRKVKWIYKTKAEKGKDVLDINGGKVMTLSAVYRLNNVILSDVLKIVEGDDNEIKNQKSSVPEKKENYVFIIDEINRGNISKIFGELITLIEDTKREGATEAMSLRLPYSNKEFSVPQNVYIIGTMNTADRSIAAMDTALRRRFQFEEMMPAVELLAEIQIKDQSGNDTNIDVQSILQTVNRRIEALYDREHTIGHAYFMPLKVKSDIDTLADIFKNKIIPLLQEYFYDDYEKIRLVLGDNQKEKVGIPQFILREQTKAEELFGPAVSDEIEFSGGKYTYSINKGLFEDSKENYIPKERGAAFVGIYDIETAKKLFGHNQTDAKQAGEGQ